MADDSCVKSPMSLLNFFHSKPNKNRSQNTNAQSDNDLDIQVEKCGETDSKKRKKERNSLTSKNKKLKLSQGSDEGHDSGISSAGNSENPDGDIVEPEVGSQGSLCEVSYLDFMENDSILIDSKEDTCGADANVVEAELVEDSADTAKCRDLMAFFSPKSQRKPLKNIDKNDKSEKPVKSCEKSLVEESKHEGTKKKTQMTFDFSGDKMKLSKQETELTSLESQESEEISIIVVSPSPEEDHQKEKEKKLEKKKKKVAKRLNKAKNETHTGTVNVEKVSDSTLEQCEMQFCESQDSSVVNTKKQIEAEEKDDSADVEEKKTRRSYLDVMAEAKKKKMKSQEVVDVDQEEVKTKKSVRKSTIENGERKAKKVMDETKRKSENKKRKVKKVVDEEEDEEQADRPRRSSRQRRSVHKSSEDSDFVYSSELVESDNKNGSPWKLRMTRLRARQKSGETVEKVKTTQLAQQILNKAKQREKQKSSKGVVNKKVGKNESVTKGYKKQKSDTKDVVIVESSAKPGKVAAIFKTKKKLTKAELKAREEEKARRDAFLQGGIPAELRLQVAQSIQASESISAYQPFPGLGESHIGLNGSSTEEYTSFGCKMRDRRTLTMGLDRGDNFKQFIDVETTGVKRCFDFATFGNSGNKNLSDEVVDVILTDLKKECADFPVKDMYKSLCERRKNELEKIEINSESKNTESKEIITLSDDDSKPAKKKKMKRKKSFDKKKEVPKEDKDVKKVDVKGNGDVALVEMYAPQKSSHVVGNRPIKKRLCAWLSEWKERIDREERIRKKALEREMKKSKKQGSNFNNDDDSDFRMSDDEMSNDCALTNTILLTGDHGRGKTSMVYALAQDLGYKVFEVSASNKRNGKVIHTQLQEATQSQHVSKSSSSFGFDKDTNSPKLVGTSSEKSLGKTLEQLQKKQSTCLSLILFDEVDLVFEEDKGFWQAIDSFMRTTKKPMIMTTSDRYFRRHFEYPIEEMVLKLPRVSHVSCYLTLVCLAEGYAVCKENLKDLVEVFGLDIRKCLNSLQFWMQSGGGVKTQKVEIVTQKKKDVPPTKDILSVCDETSDDDFQKSSKMRKSDSELEDKKRSCSESVNITKNLNLFKSIVGLRDDLDVVEGNRDNDVGIKDFSVMKDALYANTRRTLPLAKEVTSQPYPLIVKAVKTEHKKSKVSEIFDDEKAEEEVEQTEEKAELIEEHIVQKSVEHRKSEFLALSSISDLMDTYSWSDSYLPEEEICHRSQVVTSGPGTDDMERLHSYSSLNCLKDEMSGFCRVLSLKNTRSRLKNCGEIEPIPVQSEELVMRQHMDFDVDVKTEFELRRCHDNVSDQLGPLVAMEPTAMATDYLPTLRQIVKTENIKQTAKTKRRFFHYLENISVNLTPSTLETLSTWF